MPDQTKAERLDGLLAHYAPQAVAYQAQYGVWPGPGADLTQPPSASIARQAAKLTARDGLPPAEALRQATSADQRHRQAPYVIQTTGDMQSLLLTADDGRVLAGSGPTLEDALAQLEAGMR